LWKRLRERKSSRLLITVAFTVLVVGGIVWTSAYPRDYQSCRESEMRNFLARTLVEKGFRVECRKESSDSNLMVQFRLRNFNQFVWWAGNQSIVVINEQPGYFWFLRTDMVPGFVTYGF